MKKTKLRGVRDTDIRDAFQLLERRTEELRQVVNDQGQAIWWLLRQAGHPDFQQTVEDVAKAPAEVTSDEPGDAAL